MRGPILLAAAAAVCAARGQSPVTPALTPTDPDIQAIVSGISQEQIQKSIFVLASFNTRLTISDPLPSGDGIGGASAWIRSQFERISKESGGRLRVDLDTFDQPVSPPGVPKPVQVTNVVATLPGTDADSSGRTLVVCGHYDSRASDLLDVNSAAPGADDDASGVACVIELARVMSHYKFHATIVFLAVAGGEQGAIGSTHWAKGARERDSDIEAVLDNDIIGSSRSDTGVIDRGSVRLFAEGVRPASSLDEAQLTLLRAGGENDTPPRELARAIKEVAAAYVPKFNVKVIYRSDPFLRTGDHLPFLEQGYAAVRFTEPAEDFRRQHQNVRVENGVKYGDTPDHVDFAYTADVTRVNGAALAALARAPEPPQDVQIEAALLENDTKLRWAAPKDDYAAGFRIVWRDTTSAFWEHSMEVGKDVTRVMIPGVSKDNVIFGVEVFDAAGNSSPAVFPRARNTP